MTPTTIKPNNIFQRAEIGKVRTAQEDSHDMAFTPNGDVFVVCDGMGGYVGGAEASSTAVKSIIEFLNKEKYDNIPQALKEALQFANIQILGKVNENPALKGMGTTACILLLQKGKAYIAHVGDSRIYLYLSKEKKLRRITKDHSYVQTLVDLPDGHPDKISDDEAEKHPSKNRILKALGIKPKLEPTVSEKPILSKNGNVFLICSDGLSGMLPDSTIEGVLTNKSSLKEKGDLLVELALEAGGLDNITLQMIQVADSQYKKNDYKHCDFTPKSKGKSKNKSSAYKSKKLKKFIKWTIAVIILLVLGIGLYLCIKEDQKATKRAEEELDHKFPKYSMEEK